MNTLNLLFSQEGFIYQILQNNIVIEESSFFLEEENALKDSVEEQLKIIVSKKSYDSVFVLSSINHFAMTSEHFKDHDLGYQLIGYNANVNPEEEELMLSINKKYQVQFYYTFPKKYYAIIKNQNTAVHFNFSGEKFLNLILPKKKKEIHINLYAHQCEFFALEDKKVVLYNNLDVRSEVDFLYFVMFTLSKIEFSIAETYFYVYGETTQNDTFISELQKFVSELKIKFDNLPKKQFIFQKKI